ncbi:MAG: hypothetical protein ABI315_14500 [Bacteroidia bacterium]
MKINKINYEAFFLDYHEGNLSPQQVADLLLYVAQHPEFKKEFEGFENISIENKSAIYFENKNQLKKQIALSDEQLIGAVEGTLTVSELDKFNQQLKTDLIAQRSFKMYQHTKLVADTTINFENKNSLKHKESKVIRLFAYFAIAASILLLIGLFIFNNNNQSAQLITADLKKSNVKEILPVQKNEMASIKENKEKVEPVFIASNKKNHQPLAVKKSTIKIIKENANNQITKSRQEDASDLIPQEVLTEELQLNDAPLIALVETTAVKKEDSKTESIKGENNSDTYLSFPEIALKKMKEKTQNENIVNTNKKSHKKFNGWDAAQIITVAISKVTGKDIEIKTSYNDRGNLTAYAFNAGNIKFSKSK